MAIRFKTIDELTSFLSNYDYKKIKNLSLEELDLLSKNLRDYIINIVSRNGGHLSSNLGVVELIISLFYVFDPYIDKIVFDVSHQSYVFKILTNRLKSFNSLRKKNGITGFSEPTENSADLFKLGHTGTAIALAYGYSSYKKFYNNKFGNNEIIFNENQNNIEKEFNIKGEAIAIIGDGSLTNGEILETLSFIGNNRNGKLIIILNDNGMCISKTESAISKYISKLSARLNLREILRKSYQNKKIRGKLYKILLKFILAVKGFFIQENLLEDFGFQYVGPIDGHNLRELINYLKLIKEMDSSVILHLKTTKGKGFYLSEINPELFHSSPKFSINDFLECFKNEKEDFEKLESKNLKKEEYFYLQDFTTYLKNRTKKDLLIEKKAIDLISRVFNKNELKIFTDYFERLVLFSGFINKNIISLTAAMSVGTGLYSFSKIFNDRFIDVGIAEPTQVTISASLSKFGFLPIVCIYSTFAQRVLDQIYHDVVLNGLNVIFCFDRYGAVGDDGPTHHGFYTFNFASSIPDIYIYMPIGFEDFTYYFLKSFNIKKPKIIFYPKDKIFSIIKDKIMLDYDYEDKENEKKEISSFVKKIKSMDLKKINSKEDINDYKNYIYNLFNNNIENEKEIFIKKFETIYVLNNIFYPYLFLGRYLKLNDKIYFVDNYFDIDYKQEDSYIKKIAIVFTGSFFNEIVVNLEKLFLKITGTNVEKLKDKNFESLSPSFIIDIFGLTQLKPFPEDKTSIVIEKYDFIFIIEEIIEPGYIFVNFLKIYDNFYKNKIENSIQESIDETFIKFKKSNFYSYCIKNKIIYQATRKEQLEDFGIDFKKIKEDIYEIL